MSERERERIGCAPIFTKQRTRRKTLTEYYKNKERKQQRLFFLFIIPLRCPRPFRIGPFQTLLLLLLLLLFY